MDVNVMACLEDSSCCAMSLGGFVTWETSTPMVTARLGVMDGVMVA